MNGTPISVDYAYFPEVHGRDIVYYGKRDNTGVMCAGMALCDAVIIADTPEEVMEYASKYKTSSLVDLDAQDTSNIVPHPITWHTLTSEWRWVIYKEKARFVIGGKDFVASAITNTPGNESSLAADPTTIVCVGTNADYEYLRHDGAVIIGQDAGDLLMQIAHLKGEVFDVEHIVCTPLMTFAQKDDNVYYNRLRQNVREALQANPIMLLGAFSDMSIKEISENSDLIIQKLNEDISQEENNNEN